MRVSRRNPRGYYTSIDSLFAAGSYTIKLKSESISINLLMNFFSGPRTYTSFWPKKR